MARAFEEVKTILAQAAATGAGAAMDVTDFRHLELAIDTNNNASMTIKVYGSIQELPPTWTSSQSYTNQWSPIQIIDLNDQSTVTGATGIVLSGTDTHRMFEVNVNGLKWVNVIVTAYSAGNVTAQLKPFNDNLH